MQQAAHMTHHTVNLKPPLEIWNHAQKREVLALETGLQICTLILIPPETVPRGEFAQMHPRNKSLNMHTKFLSPLEMIPMWYLLKCFLEML